MEPTLEVTNSILYEAALLAEGILKFEYPITEEQHQFLTRVAAELIKDLSQAQISAA